MSKRFKLKLPVVMSSFHLCRPKHPSTLVSREAFEIRYPSFSSPSTPEHSPSAIERLKGQHRVNDKSVSYDNWSNMSAFPVSNKRNKQKTKKITRLPKGNKWLVGYEGEEDEESKRSFSNDFSYEFIDPKNPIIEKSNSETTINKKKTNNRKQVLQGFDAYRGRRSGVWQTMMPYEVEGSKVGESFVIVKKSEQPYEDFKTSMMEMIMEKEMYEANDLRELLQWFLTLNSKQYHGVIVEAFSEIWEVLFCDSFVRRQ